MNLRIATPAIILILTASCGEMRAPIDFESSSDGCGTTSLETDCGDGVISWAKHVMAST